MMNVAIPKYEAPTVGLYWKLLRTMSRTARLNLAAMLTTSVIEDEKKAETAVSGRTRAMLDKFYGAWVGDENADDTMRVIRENSTSREPIAF